MRLERTRGGKEKEAAASDFPDLPNITTEGWLRPHPRFRLQKVLVPVDFSDQSEKALQYALSIAQEFGSEIVLLNVVQPYPILPEMPASTDALTESIVKESKTRLKEWKERVRDVPCSMNVLVGSTAHAIVEFAAKDSVDLIILGTHGRTGIAHAFIGSVAERVVRLARCPTLVVRAHERDFLVAHADDAEAHGRGVKPVTAA